MVRRPVQITLSEEEKRALEARLREGVLAARAAERARIVLLAAQGYSTEEIAQSLGTRAARVSKWRTRFAAMRLPGLNDTRRPGKPRAYGEAVERRILACVQEPPPEGRAEWTGKLIARALGNVSEHQVWRVLRRGGIHLAGRDGCIRVLPAFETRTIALAGLYLQSSASALAIAADTPAGGSAFHGWVRLSDARAHARLKRMLPDPRSASLPDALAAASALLREGRIRGAGRRTRTAFLGDLAAAWPNREIYLMLDAAPLSGDRAGLFRDGDLFCLAFTSPGSWLDSLEAWAHLLGRRSPGGGEENAPRLRRLAGEFIAHSGRNGGAAFEWMAARPAGKQRG